MVSLLITLRLLCGDFILDVIASVMDPRLIGRFRVGLDLEAPDTVSGQALAVAAMSVAIFLAVVAFLLVFVSALHIPLPSHICDREKVQFFEFLIRITNEYLGDLVEYVIGPKYRVFISRFVVGFPYHFKKKSPKWLNVEEKEIDGVKCRLYLPQGSAKKSQCCIVFIHGGGWCLMEPHYYDGPLYNLISKTGATVVSIDYELSPQVTFPSPVLECERVVKAIYEKEHSVLGVDPTKIVIIGDSAGGNLTAVTCQRLLRAGLGHYVAGQVLVYPVTNVTDFQSPSYQYYHRAYKGAGLLNPKIFARMVLLYLGIDASKKNVRLVMKNKHIPSDVRASKEYRAVTDHHLLPQSFRTKDLYETPKTPTPDPVLSAAFAPHVTNPDLNPLFGKDLTGLAPAMIVTAGIDILRDEGILYSKLLESYDVPVKWYHYESAFHGIMNMPKSKQRGVIIQDIAAYLKPVL
uniref:Abhydrolase_3 domain-containing protein n=1 Tax=Panagrellus redivivus TaxID=6233 RepID=A0A7E4WCC3_PANRE